MQCASRMRSLAQAFIACAGNSQGPCPQFVDLVVSLDATFVSPVGRLPRTMRDGEIGFQAHTGDEGAKPIIG